MAPMACVNDGNPSASVTGASQQLPDIQGPAGSTLDLEPRPAQSPPKSQSPTSSWHHSSSESLFSSEEHLDLIISAESYDGSFEALSFEPPESADEANAAAQAPAWERVEFGSLGTLGYRMLFLDSSGLECSPWHDIPLHSDAAVFNFVCTTPKGSWIEYEFAKKEPFTPIKISNDNGNPVHFSENLRWNYGLLPQTWCDGSALSGPELGGLPFDDSPLQVFEISGKTAKTGDVYGVRPLGAFAVRERGAALSWKIIAIAADDSSSFFYDNGRLQDRAPHVLSRIRDWIKTCHCIQPGDPENSIALMEEAVCKEKTISIISKTHDEWKRYDERPELPNPWPPSARPIKASKYESAWSRFTVHTTYVSIPVSDSRAGSSLKYDRAWASAQVDEALSSIDENSFFGKKGRADLKKIKLPTRKQIKSIFIPKLKRDPYKAGYSGDLQQVSRTGSRKPEQSSSFTALDLKGLPPLSIPRTRSSEPSDFLKFDIASIFPAGRGRRWKSFDGTAFSLEGIVSDTFISGKPMKHRRRKTDSSFYLKPFSSTYQIKEQPNYSSSPPPPLLHPHSLPHRPLVPLVDLVGSALPSDSFSNMMWETLKSEARKTEVREGEGSEEAPKIHFHHDVQVKLASDDGHESIPESLISPDSAKTPDWLYGHCERFLDSPMNARFERLFYDSPRTPLRGFSSNPGSPAASLRIDGLGHKLRRWTSLDEDSDLNSGVLTPGGSKYKLVKGRGFSQRIFASEFSQKWDEGWQQENRKMFDSDKDKDKDKHMAKNDSLCGTAGKENNVACESSLLSVQSI